MPSSEPNPSGNEEVKSLREALRHSPNNIPLRQHLADTLLKCGLAEQAEEEYKEALALAPDNHHLKLGLARTFFNRERTATRSSSSKTL
jgi:cytochrome c-type biogenesis protein CcmH/NrfG